MTERYFQTTHREVVHPAVSVPSQVHLPCNDNTWTQVIVNIGNWTGNCHTGGVAQLMSTTGKIIRALNASYSNSIKIPPPMKDWSYFPIP